MACSTTYHAEAHRCGALQPACSLLSCPALAVHTRVARTERLLHPVQLSHATAQQVDAAHALPWQLPSLPLPTTGCFTTCIAHGPTSSTMQRLSLPSLFRLQLMQHARDMMSSCPCSPERVSNEHQHQRQQQRKHPDLISTNAACVIVPPPATQHHITSALSQGHGAGSGKHAWSTQPYHHDAASQILIHGLGRGRRATK